MKRLGEQAFVFLAVILLAFIFFSLISKFNLENYPISNSPAPIKLENVEVSSDDESFCTVTPITEAIRSRIGEEVVEIFNLQEEYNRYFIVMDKQDKWSVYDVGQDGLIDTGDDAVYLGEKIDKSDFWNSSAMEPLSFITSVDINFNEKLFWINRDIIAKTVTVKSCTLNNQCKDVKTEMTLLEDNFKLWSISPILAVNKGQNPILYLSFLEYPYNPLIASCKLYGDGVESCKNIGSFSKLNQISEQVNNQFYPLKDTGLISSREIFYYSTEKITPLWRYYELSRLIGPGVITAVETSANPAEIRLMLVDLVKGNSILTIDLVKGNFLPSFIYTREPIILDMKSNRLIMLYGEPWVIRGDLYAKVVGSSSGKVVLNDFGHYSILNNIVYLAGGQFIAEGKSDKYSEETPEDIVLFTCTI